MSQQPNDRRDTIDPTEWISTTEAARLMPSPRRKKTHPSTIVRWVLSGRLEGRRRGQWWFVRRADVLALLTRFTPAGKLKLPPANSVPTTPQWALDVLDRAGI